MSYSKKLCDLEQVILLFESHFLTLHNERVALENLSFSMCRSKRTKIHRFTSLPFLKRLLKRVGFCFVSIFYLHLKESFK